MSFKRHGGEGNEDLGDAEGQGKSDGTAGKKGNGLEVCSLRDMTYMMS